MSEPSPGSPGSPGGFVTCGDVCWPEPVICDDCCTLDLETLPADLVQMGREWAVHFLYVATGRRYGGCPRTYRPCREKCAPGFNCCGGYAGTGLMTPVKLPWAFEWVNVSCGVCRGGCQCSQVSEVILPDVGEVLGVRIDGIDYDPCGMVAVYDRSRIVRIDGGAWPTCQELSRIDGPGTWSITITQGQCVPAGGAFTAGLLMCEFLKGCLNTGDCRLPRRLQTITRQGVTIGFADQFEQLGMLRTGIWEIDAWIEQGRFAGAASPSIVSPDVVRPSELTWPLAGQCGGSR